MAGADRARQAPVGFGVDMPLGRPAHFSITATVRSSSTANLKTANAIGLTVPNAIQLLADEVITIEDILRATQILEDGEVPALGSPLLDRVVLPAIAEAERLFSGALSRISIADLQVRG
jgi:hypothetical protein